jgi:hypothetical protein
LKSVNPTRSLRGRSICQTAARLSALAITVVIALGLAGVGSAQAATASPVAPALSLAPIPLNTLNWSGHACCGSRAPAWYKDSSGVIHLQGAVTQTDNTGPGANLIGTLPRAARPHSNIFTIVHTASGTYADLFILANGQIGLIRPLPPRIQDYSFVSLENIAYRPSAAGSTRLAVNTLNWSGRPCCAPRAPAWYKDRSGVIHLQGAVFQFDNTGPGANLIGTLPRAARPHSNIFTIVHTAQGTYADLAILANGQIGIIHPRVPALGDYAFVSLESITYRPSAAGSAGIAVNTVNWSGHACCRSRGPAWYKDSSGVIHLQGAVTQTDSTGPGANLIGTLPRAARPHSNIFTIVHTASGTYADLFVLTNGHIGLIDPPPPLVKDYSFVSLESITYRP